MTELRFLDLSAEQPNPPKPWPNPKRPAFRLDARGLAVVRKPKDVCGIGIHQTAVVFGPKNDRPRAWRRALGVHAHYTCFQDGMLVCGYPPLWRVNHGHGLNGHTVGLELDGHFAGEPGIRGLLLPKLTPLQAEFYRAALRRVVIACRAAGMPIEYVWAHRQSSLTRRGDPGYEIWQQVVLPVCLELGLKTENWKVFVEGRKIPKSWDPASTEKY